MDAALRRFFGWIRIGALILNFMALYPTDEFLNTPCAERHFEVLCQAFLQENDPPESPIEHMKSKGFEFPNKIVDFGTGRYLMAMALDNLLLELFESFTDGEPDDVNAAFDMDE
ncbi:hypothetical protein Dalk_1291 [Desulfatibacillum aliphaticivorans]|uniref:Uncharacterized protein n=2 Tax=Desulfatibacillum aliphaticivorans TaxID=218208 RepID=B8F9P8_DESAL|nr:hypothetical protein Dalk_1291 [Desulfatibacillum aliphaticivorans]